MNDPVALLLVTGFIDWIEMPDYGVVDMAGSLALKLGARARASGSLIGFAARWAFATSTCRLRASTRSPRSRRAALAYGVAELVHGSGLPRPSTSPR